MITDAFIIYNRLGSPLLFI